MPNPYISTAQAADMAGVTPMTIRRWIANGTLSGHQCSRDFCIDRTSLERLIEDE